MLSYTRMPHVSQRRLKRETFRSMRESFTNLMAVPRNPRLTQLLLNDVLTMTERVMLAKRLAAIVMLCRGYSVYKIHMVLKLSPSTVARLETQLENSAFPYLESLFRGSRSKKLCKEAENFWDSLFKIILMGMPPRTGKGRWKFLFEKS